ncbi:autotransporter assembly complex protein TamA [Sedimentitalea todarodis]|uniref:BamA/TamA family outer membrane protein n=1 Tax=Sedimentitalea todarodis TaxID=1631240 RepID=A0ABU3VFY4_9RHOB|nr:BamA/TamA family outer membrane protein [Sedimentitalea todarodis]MDU9005070.1 BamA/TamA family outer membrane protein [Sedimentitalea todarodis]
MQNVRWRTGLSQTLLAACVAFAPGLAAALTTNLTAPGASEELRDRLTAASSIMNADTNGLDTSQELLAASLSDYTTLIQILYDEGYFSPVINIRVNGREAADIPALDPPRTVNTVAISVQTGRSFTFGKAQIAPVTPDTEIPEGFATGQTATTGVIRDAASVGVLSWRKAGYAKARVGQQRIVANNRQAKLDADITLAPGPKLRFGQLKIPQNSTVRPEAISKIAGFPSGQTYDPAKVQKVGTRLRRTGSFSSVTLEEAEVPNPDGTLDFEAVVVDQVPRRFSFGASISSSQGLELSGSWMHRNFFGNAERFQIQGRVSNIGGEEDIDGGLSIRLDQPAKLGPDDSIFYLAQIGTDNQEHYKLTRFYLGGGVRRVFSDTLFAELGVNAGLSRADDVFGERDFYMMTFPLRVNWDKRDSKVSATKGYFLDSFVTPYLGFSDTESGLSGYFDARGYLSLTSTASIVLAGRVQLGTLIGPSLQDVSPEFLYYSGGAGTVRGQPYESLGVPVAGGISGGRSLLAVSAEVRGRITESISLVGFFDIAAVGRDQFVTADSPYHSGAGLGVRYDLGGLGPLRLDLAMPVEGTTNDGLQFYLGIGQAF